MKVHMLACAIVCSVSLVTAAPVLAKSEKYTEESIGAEKTCKSEDVSKPVKDCMNEFAEKFCKDKGHNTHVMVSWASAGDGYSNPNRIYCK